MTKYILSPLITLLSVVLLYGPSISEAQNPSSEEECSRLSDPSRNWTDDDRWAWGDRLCKGWAEVDFTKKNDGNCDRSSMSPNFVRDLLTHAPMKRMLEVHSVKSVTFKCASMKGELDLSGVRSDTSITFDHFQFQESIRANGSSLHEVAIFDSLIKGDFSAGGMTLGYRLFFDNVKIQGDLDMSGARIAYYASLGKLVLDGGRINLANIDIGHLNLSDCKISADQKPAEIATRPRINLGLAKVHDDFQILDCWVNGDILTMEAEFGALKAHRLKTTGLFYMQNSDVNGDAIFRESEIEGGLIAAGARVGALKVGWHQGQR